MKKIVLTFENYVYDEETNELYFERSGKRVKPCINGNFILKKMGIPHTLTAQRLKRLTKMPKVKANVSGLSTKDNKKDINGIIEALKRGDTATKTKEEFRVGWDVIKMCKEMIKGGTV